MIIPKSSYVQCIQQESNLFPEELAHNSIHCESSYLQFNSIIHISSYVHWATRPSPYIWTDPDAIQEESKCPKGSSI